MSQLFLFVSIFLSVIIAFVVMLKRGASKIEEKARENMEDDGLDDTEAKLWLANLNSK